MKNIKEIIALICCCNLVFPVSVAMAAPQGGKVVGGSAHIHQSGATTTINQSSNRAVINWNSFDIGKSETVRHNMPSANSAGLHRVVGGGGASQIMGQLQSNGNVYLVNPAGVVIHKGARIDANSFTATSRDISNDNFMKGNMVFDKPGRPDAEVINQGTISVKENGLAALVAPTVRNDGVIAGKLAKVALASGDSTWKLDMHGDDLITFTVDEKDVDTLHAVDGTPLAGVENSGSIKAEGGVVVLTAAQLDGIVGSVVNSGEVSAASAELRGGKIVFKGAGAGVDIVNTGTVDASSAVADGGSVRMDTDGTTRSSGVIAVTGGQQGGKVVMTGKDVALTGKAKIDVSGNKGGGTALVGGNALGKGPERNAQTTKVEKDATIVADARTKGDGGQVVVWSDEKTNFDGSITARGGNDSGNGGKVETSGKHLKVADTARVDTRASKGIHGQWLLDPMDFVIAASDGDMSGAALSSNLARGDVEIKSSVGKMDGNGDILVNDTISWTANTKLTLTAERNVNVTADITATGENAGLTIMPESGIFDLQGGRVTLSGTNPRLNIAGQSYIVINSIEAMQNIDNDLNLHYALGSDIDASVTSSWNNGRGFKPLGVAQNIDNINNFSFKLFEGILEGLGHKIYNMNINRQDEENIGIFRQVGNSGSIRNLFLENVNICGKKYVGSVAGVLGEHMYWDSNPEKSPILYNVSVSGLVNGADASVGGLIGSNEGSIINSSFSGSVTGKYYVGGLVGENGESISNSFSLGNVLGKTGSTGGLVGLNTGGNVENSYSHSSVSCGMNDVGGFIGTMWDGVIVNSYSSGSVTLDSDNKRGVGGFIGSTYANFVPNTVTNCYWDVDSSGQEQGLGYDSTLELGSSGTATWTLTELSSAQMKQQNSFINWDFVNIWSINEDVSYPQLRQLAMIVAPGPGGGTIDPGTDPNPAPTPDPAPGIDPDPEADKRWPEFNPDPDSDIDPGLPEQDRVQETVNGVNQRLEVLTDTLTQIVTFSQDYLPDVFINVLKKNLMINVSGSLISSISQFLAGNPTTFLKTLLELTGDVLNDETIEILLRMKWTSDCLNKSKLYIDKAIIGINKNTLEGTISAIENMKMAHEYKIIALLLSEKEREDVLERSENTFLENALTYSKDVLLEFEESLFGDFIGSFAGPAVKEAVEETNGVVAGICAEFLVKHGKDIAEFEKFIMTDFETPNSLKSIIENMNQIKMYDGMLQKLREIQIKYI